MKKRSYILVMVFLVALYLAGHSLAGGSIYTEIITTILAIIAAVAFWMEFRSNEQINEAQLIMELNNQFISNEKFTHVEHALELYYARYQDAKKNGTDVQDIQWDFSLELEDMTRQDMVNYLVHLEGVAALINEGVLHLNVITDLMAYRYFIAVNNPVVQKKELLPYRDYYRGCFRIYDNWSKQLGEDKVPMSEFALVKHVDPEFLEGGKRK